ncbi:MAG TPA: SpoIIE family protein phosphatase [Syntrophorhabdaceae bacterium]|nr:SpoIIE family protein phosphatase [Syntrophorhabdaceae bacterium]
MNNGKEKQPEKDLTVHGIRVFLVDDQLMVGETVRRMLAGEDDISFFFCQDPTAAIKMATEVSPTVILQDLVMPEVDGLTLVKFYRVHPKLKDVPLIVLSSKEEAITKAEAFRVGANDYLVKLPDKIELIARIRYHSKGYINLLQKNEAYDALLKSQQALAAQLASAANHVLSLLPPPIKNGPIMTDWYYIPSAQLGGDTFGYHWIDKEHFAVYLLDVCDHGVVPALLSVSALNDLRTQTLPDTDFRSPEMVLKALNETFQMEKHNNLYFTIWYGVYNIKTRKLRYGCAGHPPALLITRDNDIKELFTENMFIGGIPGIEYRCAETDVPLDCTLYVLSDGCYEITRGDGTIWGLNSLKTFLLSERGRPGSELEGLYRFVHEMSGKETLDDDFSIVKITFN